MTVITDCATDCEGVAAAVVSQHLGHLRLVESWCGIAILLQQQWI